jgi:carboxyl-terminal processing protease
LSADAGSTWPSLRTASQLAMVGTESAGEAIAIAFRGRPNTRSFGTPTCGLSTGVQQISLETGGRVAVVNSVMVDRTKERFGGVLQPDEAITDPSAIVPRALAWLRTR